MSVRLRRPPRERASYDGAPPDAGPSRRRRVAPVALAAAAVAAGGAGAAALLGGDEQSDRPGVRAAGRTAPVTRQTLVARETVEGTLGYAGTRTVLNRLATAAGGSGGETPGGMEEASWNDAGAAVAIPAAYFAPRESEPGAEERPAADPPRGEPHSGDAPSGDSPSGDSPSGDAPSPGGRSRDDTSPDGPSREESSPKGPARDDTSRDEPSGDGSAPGSSTPDGSGDGSAPDSSAPNGSAPGASSPTGSSPGAASRNGSPAAGGSTPGGDGTADPSSSGDGAADPSSSEGSGTVTALPRPGSVVRRGGTLYRLDGEPVVLMYGATPAYRDLELGVDDGRDVRQLERNLAALGFDPGTIDTEFTSTTAAAIMDWQESADLPETGAVELGRVVFLPGARRIGEHRTSVGAALSSGSEVLDTSSTRRVVTIELDAALQSLARKGDRVQVTLPDQSTVRGRIGDVGRVAREKESADAADPNTGAEQELVIDVTVRLSSKRGLGRLDEAPVSVGLAQESRRNVLAVPVEALVARRGGGYGVELAAGRRIVPVETGLFAGGYVEVSGSGIGEGTRVVVPDA
jgi:putative peptidoglycan binding protein